MARQLAESTLKRLQNRLLDEQTRLTELLETHQREREEARIAETSSERMPDPTTAEGGTMAFEYMKELSVDQNTVDLLAKVDRALKRFEQGTYGVCEVCGTDIPIERLEVLPHATMCVTCAAQA